MHKTWTVDEARLFCIHVQLCLSTKFNKDSNKCFGTNMTTTIQTSSLHVLAPSRLSKREGERERIMAYFLNEAMVIIGALS